MVLISCKYSTGRHSRYAALNYVVTRTVKIDGILSILKPVGFDRRGEKRSVSISLFPFSTGKCLCWDATCVNTYAEAHVNSSAVAPGATVNADEDGKRHKHAALNLFDLNLNQ